jgi:hypothetical protein
LETASDLRKIEVLEREVWGVEDRDLLPLSLLLALSTAPSLSQSPPDQGKKNAPLKVTVQVRLRLESWDWFNSSLADGNYEFLASQVRVGIGQERKKWDWQIELEQPTLLGLPDNAFAPAPQGITDSEYSPIARHCDAYLLASVANPSLAASYATAMALLNCLLVAYAHIAPEHALKVLRQIEKDRHDSERWFE